MPELKGPFGRTKLTKHITIFTLQTNLKEEPVIRTSPFTSAHLHYNSVIISRDSTPQLEGHECIHIFADGFVPPAALDLKRHSQDKAL